MSNWLSRHFSAIKKRVGDESGFVSYIYWKWCVPSINCCVNICLKKTVWYNSTQSTVRNKHYFKFFNQDEFNACLENGQNINHILYRGHHGNFSLDRHNQHRLTTKYWTWIVEFLRKKWINPKKGRVHFSWKHRPSRRYGAL